VSLLQIFGPRRLARLVASDAVNVARDPFLAAAIAMSVTPAIVVWLWGDDMNAAVRSSFGLSGFTHYLAPFALLIPASLIGWVSGFLLLEDRDDGLLPALAVTSVGKVGFLAYRLAATALATAILTALAAPVLVPAASAWMTIILVAAVAAAAVIYAVILPAIARNKVEGLALTKLTNIAAIVPLVALVPSPWRYLAGAIPTFWIGEIMLAPVVYLPLPAIVLAAVVVNLVWMVALARRFALRTG
jgi:fluoroquinolone transport system permease protein